MYKVKALRAGKHMVADRNNHGSLFIDDRNEDIAFACP